MAGISARRFWAKLSCLLHRDSAEREMTREMEAHMALMADDFERGGMSASDARLAARRNYGGVEQAKELHRDARSFVWLEQLLQDFRHAFRSLRKSPGFVAVTVSSLAFGIGVNAAIFTLVDGVLLKELPVAEPHRVVQVMASIGDFLGSAFSYPAYREITRQTQIFEQIAAFSPRPAMLEVAGDPQKVDLELVTGAYFSFFGARPALGRLLDKEDDRVEGARRVCVLSAHAWRAYFSGDPGILGRTIRIGGTSLEVVGVAQPDFVGAELQKPYDVWAPTALAAELTHNGREAPNYIWLHAIGRLKSGTSFAAADAQLRAASRGIEEALPKARANDGATYVLLDASKGFDSWRSRLGEPLYILMGAAGLVLLVACANLANLLLARSNERQQEYALKLALGISRARLLRQLLMESVLVALAGGLLAASLAFFLTAFLQHLFNAGNQWETLRVTPDARVLLFGLGTSLLTALIAGLYPAWRAAHTNAGPGLKGASLDGGRRGVVRRGLIVVQVTLAVTLVFGASLFARSLRQLKTIPLGYDIESVLTVGIGERGPGNSAEPKTSSASTRITSGGGAGAPTRPNVAPQSALREMLSRVRGVHGVAAAALAEPAMLSGGGMASQVELPGVSGKRRMAQVWIQAITPGYLPTMRLPLLRGRDFTAADDGNSTPVALINQALASRLAPGQDALGKHFIGWNGMDVEIVGIVADSKYGGVREKTRNIAYQPFDQLPESGGALEIRCQGGCGGVERDVRRLVKSSFPNYQVSDASSMESMRDSLIAKDRLFAFLSSLFGALGALLAVVGIYGLISYAVARRTREIGIRVSIGAQRGNILWLFLRESALLVAAGVAAGLPLGFLLSRFIAKMLFQVKTTDAAGFAMTIGFMLAAGLAAAAIPARRAASIDPVRALRYD